MSINSSFMNDPNIAISSELGYSDPIPETAVERKTSSTPSKLEQKVKNLGLIDIPKYQESSQNSYVGNLFRGAGSSLLRSTGQLYDFASTVDDRIDDYRGIERSEKNKLWDALSENKVVDDITGFDRSRLTAASKQIDAEVEAGKYGEAFKTAFSNADQFIADSASAIPEFMLGGVVAKGLGALAKVAGGAKAVNALEKVSPNSAHAVERLAQGLKLPAGASVYAANAVARDIEEYKANNNNEEPSTEWLATDFLVKSLTGIIQKEVLLKGAGKATSSATIGTVKDIAKVIGGEKASKIIAENIWRNGKLVVGSGFFEGLQEVLDAQTSQVATQMNSAKYPELDTVAKTLTSDENKKGSIVAAITGSATGSTLSAVPATVSASSLSTALGVRGTAKAVGKKIVKEGTKVADKIKDKAADSDISILHQEDKDFLQAKYQAQNDLHNDLKEDAEKENERLSKITTIVELKRSTNESVKQSLERYSDKLDDPTIIKKIVDSAIAQNNKKVTKSRMAIEAIRAKDHVYKAAQRVREAIPDKIVEKAEKAADKTVELTKDAYGVVLDEVQHLETSTARAIYDDIGNKKTYKDIGNYLDKNMEKITDKDFNALIEMTKSNEKMQSLIKKYKKQRDSAKEHLGVQSREVVGNLDKYASVTSPDVSTSAKTHRLANELFELADKNFTDPDILAKVNKAVEAYKGSSYANKNAAKSLSRRFKAGDKTSFIPSSETVDKVKTKGKSLWDSAEKSTVEATKVATKDLVKKTNDFISNLTYDVKDVKNAIARLTYSKELTESDHNYFVKRILKKRSEFQKKKSDPDAKVGKTQLTEAEVAYTEQYPERVKAAEDAILDALSESIEKAKAEAGNPTKPKTPKNNTTTTNTDTDTYAKDMEAYAKALIEGDKSKEDTSIDPDQLDDFILYVEIQKGKDAPITESMEVAYNLPDIKAYRDTKDDIIALNDKDTASDAPSRVPSTKEEIKAAANKLKAAMKEVGVEIC